MSRRYSVMLVDDEEEVAKAIARKIDWNSMGFNQPSYARNGLEALDIAESIQPDVVMSDIQMPYMNGLELCARLKELWPNTRIIIFSGYDEFEYAKEAIRLSAEEYILKPVDSEELRKVFLRIRESLDKELDEQQNVQMLESYYNESLPLMQESFFASLIEGRISESSLEQTLNDLQLSLAGPVFVVCVIHISQSHVPEGMSARLLNVAVRRLAEERLLSGWNVRYFSYLSNTVMLVQMEKEEEVTRIIDECDKFCRLAGSVSKAVVTIGIGSPVRDVREISASYSGARNAVSYRVIYGTSKAISIREIAPSETEEGEAGNEERLKEMFKQVRLEDKKHLEEAVDLYMNCVDHFSSVQEYRFFAMELVSQIYRFAKNNRLDIDAVFQSGDDMYAMVQVMEKNDLRRWVRETCLRMQEMLAEKRLDNSQSFVSKAVDYVNENFMDENLNVEQVCSLLGVSSAYFSTVFKREIGKNFTAFLTDVRMEKAVELLIEKNEKTYIIAREVGYSDPNYFSYVFKKQFGVSPSKYKQGKRSE
ncbi:MAG: response regulator [Solobacterium sp.]|nr:response regulator [Solobacterium sp.]